MNGFTLKGSTVLISGASGDIGYAAAEKFAEAGSSLILLGHSNYDALLAKADLLSKKYGAKISCFRLNIADSKEVYETAARILKEHGHIDLLINNAGISMFGLDHELSPSEWELICGVNLSGTMYLTRALLPSMIKTKSGRIINVSSMWGTAGASCEAAYSATKGAINSYTKALAKELAPCHIPVNAVAFGAIDTKMNSRLTPEEKAEFEAEIPYGRMAAPEEAADMLVNVSLAPDYMTGQIIGFDGGYI